MKRARHVALRRPCPAVVFGVGCALVACGGRTLDDGSLGTRHGTGGTTGATQSGGRAGTAPGGGRSNGGRNSGANGGRGAGTSGGGDVTSPARPGRQTQYSTDYGKRCFIDSDCAIVEEGDQCACRQCGPFAAIARVSLGDWQNDLNGIRCLDGQGTCPAIDCIEEPVAWCDNQVCRIRIAVDAGGVQPIVDASPGTGGHPVRDASPGDAATYRDL
jgi:hypothetical protein